MQQAVRIYTERNVPLPIAMAVVLTLLSTDVHSNDATQLWMEGDLKTINVSSVEAAEAACNREVECRGTCTLGPTLSQMPFQSRPCVRVRASLSVACVRVRVRACIPSRPSSGPEPTTC